MKTNKAHDCPGNHDLAAWNKVAEAADDPRYGKNLPVQKFGMRNHYHSFDHSGWHFVVLDYLRVTAPGKFIADRRQQWSPDRRRHTCAGDRCSRTVCDEAMMRWPFPRNRRFRGPTRARFKW